jgi:hypothetical protein
MKLKELFWKSGKSIFFVYFTIFILCFLIDLFTGNLEDSILSKSSLFPKIFGLFFIVMGIHLFYFRNRWAEKWANWYKKKVSQSFFYKIWVIEAQTSYKYNYWMAIIGSIFIILIGMLIFLKAGRAGR